jgi:hypothetical protein
MTVPSGTKAIGRGSAPDRKPSAHSLVQICNSGWKSVALGKSCQKGKQAIPKSRNSAILA